MMGYVSVALKIFSELGSSVTNSCRSSEARVGSIRPKLIRKRKWKKNSFIFCHNKWTVANDGNQQFSLWRTIRFPVFFFSFFCVDYPSHSRTIYRGGLMIWMTGHQLILLHNLYPDNREQMVIAEKAMKDIHMATATAFL